MCLKKIVAFGHLRNSNSKQRTMSNQDPSTAQRKNFWWENKIGIPKASLVYYLTKQVLHTIKKQGKV